MSFQLLVSILSYRLRLSHFPHYPKLIATWSVYQNRVAVRTEGPTSNKAVLYSLRITTI